MIITNAKYVNDIEFDRVSHIKVTLDGVESTVPIDTANRHYEEILKQVADGDITIEEAD